MAASFSITRTTTRFHDSNGNGVKDPGEQDFDSGEIGVYDPGDILYTRINITNTGSDPATGVTIQDVTTGTTPVANPNDPADLSWINISPIASNDSFTAVGNTVLRVGTANSINGGESTFFAGNLTSNDVGSLTGDDVPGFQIDTVTSGVSAKGGTFNIFSDGTFNYLNDSTDTDAELSAGDSFTYKIRDAGFDGVYNTADDLTSTATVTITFSTQSGAPGTAVNRVWYVDGAKNTDGNGTSANPFQSSQIASKLSGAGDVDANGHIIYVENTASGSITLEASQKLIGTGEELNVGGFAIAADSGGNSALNATSGFAVTLSTGNTIAGINLGGTGGISGSSFGTLTVTDDVVLNTTGAALSLTTGAFAGTGFASTTSTGGLQNVLLSGVSGTVNLGSGALSGATGVSPTEGNLVVIGGSANVNYSGTIGQGAADVAALNVRGAHTGTINLTGNITATGGLGLQFTDADGAYNLTGVISLTGVGEAGIDIVSGSNGAFTFGTASNLATVTNNSGGDAFVVTNSNANVTFNGTITDNNGNAVNIDGHDGGTITFQNGSINSTGSGIDVANSNGGAINFNSQVTLGTGASTGIILINNNGSTTSFNPTGSGLDITTSSGSGFIATNGGTITIADSGTGNSINVTGAAAGATAFSATGGTTFGAGGVIFDSISQSGGTNAIILNGTGSTAGLTILGTGSTNSGGTIQNTTGDSIVLTSTSHVSLNWVRVTGSNADGIKGNGVNNFTFANSSVSNWGDTLGGVGEDGMDFTNLTGTVAITSSTIGAQRGFTDAATPPVPDNKGIMIRNDNVANLNMTVTGTTFQGIDNDGIDVEIQRGTGTLNVTGSTFSGINGRAITFGSSADNAANGTLNLNVNNNSFTNVGIAARWAAQGGTTINAVFRDNTLSAIENDAIRSLSDPSNSSFGSTTRVNATVEGNNMGGGSIFVVARRGSRTDMLLGGETATQTGNTNIGGFGIDANASDGAILNLDVLNNTVAANVPEPGAISASLYISTGGVGATTITTRIAGNSFTADINDDPIANVVFDAAAGSTIRIEGWNGSPANNPQAYLESTNTFPNDGVFNVAVATVVTGFNGDTLPTGGPVANPIQAEAPAAPAQSDDQAVGGGLVDNGTVDNSEGGSGNGAPAPTPAGPVVVDDGILSQAELDLIVDAAIQRWAAAGASEEQIAAMRAVKVSVADLGGLTLGESNVGTIVLDSDAAGWNWFIDSTPGDDSEYAGSGSRLLAADKLGAAGTRIDLLTVLTHELGHQIGLSDLSAPGSGDELMFGTIGAGERRLPGSDDLSHAGDSPVAGAFAFAPITLGTIPAGQTVVVEYQQTINAPAEDGLVGSWTGQSIVDSTETLEELSNTESGNVDGLALGDRIFNDNNKNGLYDAGDSTFAGVVLTLYADTNNDGDYDEGVDLYVGYNEVNGVPGYQQGVDTPAAAGTGTALKATTNASGHYSFSGLAPGDYIVRVDASNFQAGGALFGKVSTPGVKNPNDTNADGDSNVAAPADVNVDNDDNGEQFLIGQAGTYAASRAIRLDYGQETVAGPTGPALDTNNSLDLAFFAPNAAPVIGAVTGDAQTYYENGAPIAIDLGGNATVTDEGANFDGGSLTVSWNGSTGDRLTFGSGTSFDGNNDVFVGATKIGTLQASANQIVISFNADATPANVQTLIRAFQFDVNGNTPTAGVRTFTFTLVDGDGNDGGLGNDTGTATATITVVPVSDAPEGADRTGTGLNDSTGAAYAFTVADFATGFTDPNDSPANSFSGVKITTLPSASAGTIYFDSNPSDATPGVAIAAGDTFTAQDLTDGKLTFVGAPGSGGMAMSFTFQVIDNGSTDNGGVVMDGSPNTFSTTIVAGNSAPVLDLDGDDSSNPSTAGGFKSSYTEGGAAAAVADVDVSITDSNSADDIVSATITITNPETGDKLNVGTLPGSVTHDVANSSATVVKLTAAPGTSRADFEAALKAITFENSGDDPTDKGTNLSRTVTVVVNDGTADSNTATATIAVTDVNDAPTGTSSTITAVEDAHRTLSTGDFGFADVDGTFASVTISAAGGGGIYYDADGAGNASTPQLRTLPDTFTVQDLVDGKVSFRADANANGTAAATITFKVNDDDGAASADSNVLTVNVTAVNDSPVLTTPGPIAATEQTAVAILAAGSVSDPDLDARNGGLGDYAGATFSVNRNPATNTTEDVFTLVAGPNFTIEGSNLKSGGWTFATISVNGSAGLLVINFTSSEAFATSALVDEVIQAVRYTNTSDAPPASVNLAVGFTDGSPGGGQGSGQPNLDVNVVTVNIAAVNDLPAITVEDDSVSGTEDSNLVFSSTNGNAITVADADNTSLTVTLTVTKGTLTLFQTTGLTVTGDGTATVEVTGTAANINAALEGLIYRGNLNYQGTDTLAIEVDDGTAVDTENVAITLSDDGFIDGDGGNNVLNGTPQTDLFRLQQGGNDTANGLGSNDAFYFGAAFTAADTVNGGDGIDILILQGDYSAGVTFGTGGTSNISSIESISLFPGNLATYGDISGASYSYNLTMLDGNVDAGAALKVNGSGLRTGENFNFNGSAETNGQYLVYAGRGTDTLTGGAMSDSFVFNFGRFNAGDTVNGGGGYDVVYLRGDYLIDFNAVGFAGSLANVESVGLLSFSDTNYAGGGDGEFDYSITWNDAMLATGQTITFNGSRLGAEENMEFNGSAESDGGKFRLFGGGGNDVLTGGSGADLIVGGRRGDTVTGGAGNDIFRYDSVEDSNSTEADGIQDFNLGDLIDLSRIDANTLIDGDQAFTFIGEAAAFSGAAGELRFENVSMGGTVWRIFGDVNGDGVSDFEVQLVINPADPITASDFIL